MPQHNELASSVGERVRAARTHAKLSRRLLADAADVSERYLVQLESGEANVSLGILARVARALDVQLVSFLPREDCPPISIHPAAGIPIPLSEFISSMTLREQHDSVPVLKVFIEKRRRSLKGIALLGLRGAGKTTIGSSFAARHGLRFVSVTREIETRAGMTLNDLFNLGGPDAYRALENEVVAEVARSDERIVLETAGGVVSNKDALEVIMNSFQTVWVKASPEEHLQRVIRQGDMRPIHGAPKAMEHLKALLAQRESDYGRADCILDTTHREPEACVDILEKLAGALFAAKAT